MQTIRDIPQKLLGGRGIVRIDLNEEGEWRLLRALPTLQALRKEGGSLVILSHKGRPKGYEAAESLKSQAEVIGKLMGEDIAFLPFASLKDWNETIQKAEKGSVFLADNLRFFPGEQTGDRVFAKALSLLGDYYVNEAFPVSHRADASIALLPEYLPAYGGLNLEAERNALEGFGERAEKPFLIILGGGKAHDKLGVIRYLKDQATAFLLGGVPANTILKARGINVKHSVVDEDPIDTKLIEEVAAMESVITPIDWREDGARIVDIGEETIQAWIPYMEKAKTILWNGPMGFFEEARYGAGSEAVAELVAEARAYSLVGGGETVDFLHAHHYDDRFDFLSTGGGAMLALLGGEPMPGLEALDRVASSLRKA